MRVVLHGGAGGTPGDPDERQAVLDRAAARGAAADDPLDAVEEAVRVLESGATFNAGVGSAVQSDGAIRTDAGLMTDDRRVGAVCSLAGVEHAVSAARVVLAETPHVFLSGDRAVELAESFGVETGVDLWTERRREQWADLDPPAGDVRAQLEWIRERFGGGDGGPPDHDTVGGVATDGERVAAATSTGGRWLALAGRVGDVPQAGSGFYATERGGASATGDGEDIVRTNLSRRAVELLADHDAQAAADAALGEFVAETGATAGLVVCSADGDAGSAYNSTAMQTAVDGDA